MVIDAAKQLVCAHEFMILPTRDFAVCHKCDHRRDLTFTRSLKKNLIFFPTSLREEETRFAKRG